MQEQYREANDRVRVPEELLRRTEAAVRQEEKKRKIYVFRRYAAVAAAACLCLVCFGVLSFSVRDRIIVQDVEISQDEFSAGMNLGGNGIAGDDEAIRDISAGDGETEEQDGQKENTQNTNIRVEKYDSADEVPGEMWELQPSRINRQQVYIGRSGDIWYAAFEKDGVYWFAEADNTTEEELAEYLKNIL